MGIALPLFVIMIARKEEFKIFLPVLVLLFEMSLDIIPYCRRRGND
jgi:hypothetical protein